jgi:RNase H-like domain found in reverse transcriptase
VERTHRSFERGVGILRKEKFLVKKKKYMFRKEEVGYLGFIVRKRQVKMDLRKVEAVSKWPIPQNQKKVRGFLGLVNYYQKFIHRYAHMAVLLNELLRKERAWKWNEKEQEAFEQLKETLQKVSVLRIAEERRKFRIETDASDVVIRVVLLQQWKEWHPVAYISRKLIDAKTRYFTYDKKMLAFRYALKKWRCYVQGLEFEVYTDHNTLVNLTTQKELKGR